MSDTTERAQPRCVGACDCFIAPLQHPESARCPKCGASPTGTETERIFYEAIVSPPLSADRSPWFGRQRLTPNLLSCGKETR